MVGNRMLLDRLVVEHMGWSPRWELNVSVAAGLIFFEAFITVLSATQELFLKYR